MDLSAVITRLQAQLTGFKSIGAAADLDAAINGPVATPSAFVLPLSDRGTPMDLLGRTSQSIDQVFGVALVLTNKRDAQGAASLNDLVSLRLQLKAALIGWIPDAATAEPVHFQSGQLMRLDGDGRLWWLDTFSLKTFYWST